MKKKSLADLNELLCTYICRDDYKNLTDVLDENSSLNVINSKFFNIAIESQNTSIVKALLDYFERNQLFQYADESLELLRLKKEMHDILEVAIEDVEISEEMKEALCMYINIENSNESEQDLEGIEISQSDSSDEESIHNGATLDLTESNIALLDHFNDGLYNIFLAGQH